MVTAAGVDGDGSAVLMDIVTVTGGDGGDQLA